MSMSVLEHAMVEWVQSHLHRNSIPALEITPESDLLETGVLDSVAFLDLISYAEELSGTAIDLMSVDPAQLTSIRGLCLHVQATSTLRP